MAAAENAARHVPLPPPASVALAICAAAALFEGFDNQSMGVAAPLLFRELSVAPSQAGIIFSAATFGLFFGAAIGGRASDHIGRQKTLTISLLLFGLCSLLTAASGSARMVLLLRVLTGLGCGGAMPAFISMASEAVESNRRLAAVTLVMAALPLGGALAGVMALGDSLGWGWRPIFIVGGIAPIIVALALLVTFHRSPRASEAQPRRAARGSPTVSIGTALWGGRAGATILLWIGFFFTQLVLFLMVNWLPSLIIGLGFSRSEASLTSIGFNLAGCLGAALLGRFHAGPHRRLWVILTYGGIAVALLGLVAMSASGKIFSVAIVASSLAGVFIVGAQLILFALAPLYYSAANRGTGVGAAVAIGRLGSVVGPLLASAVLTAGRGSATVLTSILPFVILGGAAALGLTWQAQSGE
ncbi:MAG TPA: MFS transporter [Steroidobacteraceae bacterium]|jgi:AAHS family 3-hydroxyphenylpropionic acid transporter|nr:MFS transporter [Steroidobacteraceae bacterium]